ncbi:MAG: GDSL-type esterase/lipase family protein [Woeseiaceae bacterium]
MSIARSALILLTAILGACAGESSSMVAPDDPNIRYTGRWNHDNPQTPWVGWQGSTVSIQFVGDAISAEVDFGDEGERLRIIVDGVPQEPARPVPAGRQTILLTDSLNPEEEHTVVLMKEEYATSIMSFHGFDIGDGEIRQLPPRPEKRIAFFGDSNMEGYSLYNEKNDGTNGTYFAYPATVSRMLGAEMYLQAVGSATLDGPTPNDVVSFVRSEAYDREDPAYADGFEPDLIVVNAGANDIYRVDPENKKEAVKQHYRNAIEILRGAYGDDPHIVLFNAYSWDDEEPVMYSHEIVDEIGGNLSALPFPWCWEQWHGDMVDHSGQAGLLANYIASLNLGFSIEHDLDVVNGYGVGFDVANGSFEGAARDNYGGFGWRYFTDGVERVAVSDAAHGEFVIRLEPDEKVHQCVDPTGDFLPQATSNGQQYELTAAIRSVGDSGTAILGADYQEQTLYKRENGEQHEFAVDSDWQDFTATLTAPDGTWQTYVILKSLEGELEFDNIRLRGL